MTNCDSHRPSRRRSAEAGESATAWNHEGTQQPAEHPQRNPLTRNEQVTRSRSAPVFPSKPCPQHRHRVAPGSTRQALDTTFDGVVFRVFPRLKAITRQDVESWAADHGCLHLFEAIKTLFRDYEEKTGDRSMPMEVIGKKLQALITQHQHVPGGMA